MLDGDRDRRYWDCLDQAMQESQEGRFDEALAWLDEALRANPRGAEARNGRGEILWDRGRCDDALREFRRAVEADPECFPAHLNRMEILIEEFQEHEEALDLGDALLQGTLDPPTEAEVYYLKSKALFYLEDLDGALFLLRRAIRKNAEQGMYHGFEGQILFELGRFEDALRSLERARGLEPDSGHTLYHLALAYEHLGEHDRAEQLFERAEREQPEVYPRPVRISEEAFHAAAERALATLPASIRKYVRGCPILVRDLPDRRMVIEQNLSPQLLGLFQGVPATEPGHAPGLGGVRDDVDCILLFKRNLEKMATDERELVEQIQITVKHEIGHYLGLDEDDLERLGLG
jgi:tetratricopeptide (TPR) repeat protein